MYRYSLILLMVTCNAIIPYWTSLKISKYTSYIYYVTAQLPFIQMKLPYMLQHYEHETYLVLLTSHQFNCKVTDYVKITNQAVIPHVL